MPFNVERTWFGTSEKKLIMLPYVPRVFRVVPRKNVLTSLGNVRKKLTTPPMYLFTNVANRS